MPSHGNASIYDRVGRISAWVCSGIIVIAGLGALAEHQALLGAFLLVMAAVIAPPLKDIVVRQFGWQIPFWLRAAAVVGLLVGIGYSVPPSRTEPESRSEKPEVAAFSPDLTSVASTKVLMLDDFTSYIAGFQTTNDWSDLVKIDKRISPRELYAAYHENEVSADEMFKGERIAMTGQVESINKDFLGSIYLVLADSDPFGGVHAFLEGKSSDQAGQIARYSKITIVCTGAGMVLSSPIMKDCHSAQTISEQNRSTVEYRVDQFFLGKDVGFSDKTKILIGLLYARIVNSEPQSVCRGTTKSNIQDCMAGLKDESKDKSTKDKFVASYDELARHVQLPPRSQALNLLKKPNQSAIEVSH